MPSFKQMALIGLAAASLLGCDAGSNPDAEARNLMNEGRISAARGDKEGRDKAESDLKNAAEIDGASFASIAQAHAALGQVQYEAGLELLRQADRKELAGSRIALQIAALGSQLGNSATLVQGYQKLEPTAAKVAIEQKVVEAKGGADKPKWFTDDKITIATLSGAAQEASRMQGEISKRQAAAKDLDAQRVAALEEAEKAMKTSESAKGKESVDAYKQYSNAKKKAADLQAQIDLLQGQIIPLQGDLAIATGQQQILQAAVEQFQTESKTLDEGWKDIQTKIAAQVDLIKQIASAADATTQPAENPSASGKSIAVKATILAQTIKQADDARNQAAEKIGSAVKEFTSASSSANDAGKDMSEQAANQPAVASVIKITHDMLTPHVFKLRQATAERVLAEMQLSKAAGIAARIKLRDMLTPLMKQADQPMPKELADTTLEAQMKEAVASAAGNFDEVGNHLADIIDGPGADPIAISTKKIAAISRIFLIYGQGQLALLQGNAAKAKESDASARLAVKAAAEMQVTFPRLPGDLAAAIPPPPPPPAPVVPATEPTEGATPAAPATPTEGAAPAEGTTPTAPPDPAAAPAAPAGQPG